MTLLSQSTADDRVADMKLVSLTESWVERRR